MGFLIRIVVNAFAIWVETLTPALETQVIAFSPGQTVQFVLTLLVVALVYAVVNTIIGTVIKIIAYPLFILAVGLILPLIKTGAAHDHGLAHPLLELGSARRRPVARHPRRTRDRPHQLAVRHHPLASASLTPRTDAGGRGGTSTRGPARSSTSSAV